MENSQFISIIVPVFNEEESLEILYTEISEILNQYPKWEMIFIDDGSRDGSYSIMKKIADQDHNISIIRFFKNFGKADALSEGFNQSKGDIIITMDGDLQDDPSEIPSLIEKIQKGWDVVSGWKKIDKIHYLRKFLLDYLIL